MKLKSFSFILIFFIFFSLFTSVYATEENENYVEIQEESSENIYETEFEENEDTENVEEEEIEEESNEENQEEQTENITVDYSEQLDKLCDLLNELKIYYCCYVFLFCVWFIIDFIRHAFFREGR